MKVVIICSSVSRSAGGMFFSVKSIFEHLISKSYFSPFLYSFRDKYTDCDLHTWRFRSAIKICSKIGIKSLYINLDFVRDIVAERPAIIHLNGLWLFSNLAALLIKMSTGTKLIVSPRGMLDPWAMNQSKRKKRIAWHLFVKHSLTKADCIHVLCESEYRAVRDLGFRNPVAIISNGTDPIETSAEMSWLDFIGSDKYRTQTKKLLFLGRLDEKKGLDCLYMAWNSLASDIHDRWDLIVVGPGSEEYKIRLASRLTSASAIDSVFCCAPVYGESKAWLFQNSHGFILPSLSEGVPMAALEAMSAGLPIMISKASNVDRLHEERACIDCGTSVGEIRSSISAFCNLSENMRLELGASARACFSNYYTWDRQISHFVSVYKWLHEGGPSPAALKTL